MSVSLICLGGSERAEVVGGGRSWVGDVILESMEGDYGRIVVRTKASGD